jgi:hypothetical protein
MNSPNFYCSSQGAKISTTLVTIAGILPDNNAVNYVPEYLLQHFQHQKYQKININRSWNYLGYQGITRSQDKYSLCDSILPDNN